MKTGLLLLRLLVLLHPSRVFRLRELLDQYASRMLHVIANTYHSGKPIQSNCSECVEDNEAEG